MYIFIRSHYVLNNFMIIEKLVNKSGILIMNNIKRYTKLNKFFFIYIKKESYKYYINFEFLYLTILITQNSLNAKLLKSFKNDN
jgi:hypothetical protein